MFWGLQRLKYIFVGYGMEDQSVDDMYFSPQLVPELSVQISMKKESWLFYFFWLCCSSTTLSEFSEPAPFLVSILNSFWRTLILFSVEAPWNYAWWEFFFCIFRSKQRSTNHYIEKLDISYGYFNVASFVQYNTVDGSVFFFVAGGN